MKRNDPGGNENAAPAAKRSRVGAPGASTNAIPALNGAGAAGGV